MPKILVISRYFPPIGSAGASIRLTKLIKYALPEGWSFVILTQDPDKPVVEEKKLSSFLLDELPTNLDVKIVANPIYGSSIFYSFAKRIFKESSILWGIKVFLTGMRLFKNYHIDLIFVNSPPFTNVATGWLISKLKKIPLIIDIKDDWVGSYRYQQKKKINQKLDVWIEKKILRDARIIYLPTENSYTTYTERYKSINPKAQFILAPNGIDLEEYSFLEKINKRVETNHFTILTAASGYRPDYRDLFPFINCLKDFLERIPEANGNVDVVFLGDQPDRVYQEFLENISSKAKIIYKTSLSRKEFVEWLWRADLFFLIQPIGNRTAISGTLYEYWATGKAPILLISEEGASSSLVENHNIGEHFEFTQVEGISRYIEKLFKAYACNNPIWIDRTGIAKYDRKDQVKKMVSHWHTLVIRENQ